jgi:hypothetical protein
MLKDMFSNLFTLSSIIGVDVALGGTTKLISSCKLQIQGTILSSSANHSELRSVLHFSKQYKPGPVAINVRGKGVLVRKTGQLNQLDQQAFHSILPNANLKDFYTQVLKDNEGNTVSLIRKVDADALINEFESHGFTVIGFTLDGFNENEAYQVGFSCLIDDQSKSVHSTTIDLAALQIRAKAKLTGIGVLAGPALLLLLLLNFFVHDHYTSLVAACKLQTVSSSAQVARLRAVENRLKERTSMIKGVGWTAGLRYGYLTDRLLAKTPAQISIEQIAVNPLNPKQAQGLSAPLYSNATTVITGNCTGAAELNDWLFVLKSAPRIANCTIQNYAINRDTGRGQFSITLQLSDDKL